jgi:hypothetical protein
MYNRNNRSASLCRYVKKQKSNRNFPLDSILA